MDIDPTHISNALQIFNSAFTTSNNLKVVFDRSKNIISRFQGTESSAKPSGDLEAREVINVLRGDILDAQDLNFALREQIAEIREAYVKLKQKQEDFDRYELSQTPLKATVLKLKAECTNGEPVHYLCPDCKETGRKAILQGLYTKHCHVCEKAFAFDTPPEVTTCDPLEAF